MAADPRRNPPPGWTVKKSGSLPSMVKWECSHPDCGSTIPFHLRRLAVADAWRTADLALHAQLVAALHAAGWNPDNDHLIGQPRMGVFEVDTIRVIVSADHSRWVVQGEDGSFLYDGSSLEDAAKAVVAAF